MLEEKILSEGFILDFKHTVNNKYFYVFYKTNYQTIINDIGSFAGISRNVYYHTRQHTRNETLLGKRKLDDEEISSKKLESSAEVDKKLSGEASSSREHIFKDFSIF